MQYFVSVFTDVVPVPSAYTFWCPANGLRLDDRVLEELDDVGLKLCGIFKAVHMFSILRVFSAGRHARTRHGYGAGYSCYQSGRSHCGLWNP